MIPFRFSRVDQNAVDFEKIMEEVFRLRYKVYCDEWGFEKAADYPDGMERNEFDAQAEHFIIQSTVDNTIIGTARVIFPGELGYAVTRHCIIDTDLQQKYLDNIRSVRIGEVSRLAISKEYRKRIEDDVLTGFLSDVPEENLLSHEKRKCNYVHEFYKFILLQSMELELTHWYVAMKRGLYVLLKRVG
ncbi:PEP-CTERM/exosortase system-associated acyltransferase, partial [bacterium]|nr:PEP-CTERM/exosortase system-associated acyltransferase [bacterium]